MRRNLRVVSRPPDDSARRPKERPFSGVHSTSSNECLNDDQGSKASVQF